jgi:hypothetical protein
MRTSPDLLFKWMGFYKAFWRKCFDRLDSLLNRMNP